MHSDFVTRLVGVLNLTPDSFSDGGSVVGADAAALRLRGLIFDGADVVDIGAESTRPGATQLSPDEEKARLEPLLAYIRTERGRLDCRISVDTRHAATARAALAAGCDWINDVSGGASLALLDTIAASRAHYVLMHSLSVPANPTIVIPQDADAVAYVLEWAVEHLAMLATRGITTERVVFDPGLGFGKTAAQSLALLRGISRFRVLGVPILIGHSRKSWITSFHQVPAAERDVETLAASLILHRQGVDYLRVHNVAWHRRGFNIATALL